MIKWPHRPRAAFLTLLAAATGLGGALAINASAQTGSVEVPAYRAVGASEPMTAPGESGTDYSANPPSLAGLTLLATIPAPTKPRRGFLIQAQCAAGLDIALDDPNGATAPTVIILSGAGRDGGQGSSIDMSGVPHTGRIRIYSTDANCQVAARSW
jgi:hypothetical protein